MSTRNKVLAVAAIVLLASCGGGKEKVDEMSALKAALTEQVKRVDAIEPDLNSVKNRADEDGKAILGLNESVESVKATLQDVTQSQVDMKDNANSLVKLNMMVNDLQTRVQALEKRMNERDARNAKAAESAPSSVKSVALKPKLKDPPFLIVGVEYRAAEPFLSIISKDSHSLSDVKLVQPPELAADDWRLKAITATKAVFIVDGREQTVALP